MKDIESYIKENRAEMDIHTPDPALWDKIGLNLPGRRKSYAAFFGKAAIIILVCGTSLTLFMRSFTYSHRESKAAVKIIRETDQYYNSLLMSLYSEAEPLLTANPDINMELANGMNELDSISVEIRKDLKDNIATAEVVEALIFNYRLRIELLEDMLKRITEEENETEKNSSYEI